MIAIESSRLSIKTVLIAIAISSVELTSAQVAAAIDGDLRLNIGVFDEGTIIPFYTGFASVPVHPGGILGIELYYRKGRNHQLFQTLNLGYYYHRRYEHGLFVDTEFGYRYVGSYGFFIELLVGAGYLHTLIDGTTFTYNESTGEFENDASGGRPHAMAPLITIGTGFDFSQNGDLPIAIYLRYQAFLELPYCPEHDELLMSHTAFYVGLLINIGSIKR